MLLPPKIFVYNFHSRKETSSRMYHGKKETTPLHLNLMVSVSFGFHVPTVIRQPVSLKSALPSVKKVQTMAPLPLRCSATHVLVTRNCIVVRRGDVISWVSDSLRRTKPQRRAIILIVWNATTPRDRIRILIESGTRAACSGQGRGGGGVVTLVLSNVKRQYDITRSREFTHGRAFEVDPSRTNATAPIAIHFFFFLFSPSKSNAITTAYTTYKSWDIRRQIV